MPHHAQHVALWMCFHWSSAHFNRSKAANHETGCAAFHVQLLSVHQALNCVCIDVMDIRTGNGVCNRVHHQMTVFYAVVPMDISDKICMYHQMKQ